MVDCNPDFTCDSSQVAKPQLFPCQQLSVHCHSTGETSWGVWHKGQYSLKTRQSETFSPKSCPMSVLTCSVSDGAVSSLLFSFLSQVTEGQSLDGLLLQDQDSGATLNVVLKYSWCFWKRCLCMHFYVLSDQVGPSKLLYYNCFTTCPAGFWDLHHKVRIMSPALSSLWDFWLPLLATQRHRRAGGEHLPSGFEKTYPCMYYHRVKIFQDWKKTCPSSSNAGGHSAT